MSRNSASRRLNLVTSVAHFLALFLAMLIICAPGAWIILNSLRPTVEIMAKPAVWIPHELNLEAYRSMFSLVGQGGIPVWAYFRNSLIVSVTSTIIAIAIGMSGGYAFARFRFAGKSAWFLGLMLSRTVPGIALSLPLFIVYARLGIIDTHLALIVAYVALNVPFTIWLIDGFFRQVPRDLAEAAQIDGCRRSGRSNFRSQDPASPPPRSSPFSPPGTSSRWPRSSPARSIRRRCRWVCWTIPPSSRLTGAACARWRWSWWRPRWR